MTEKIIGIVIDVVRHSDRHNVVTLYTRSRGRMSFLSPAGSKGKGRMRNARLSPLAIVEADINVRANRELQLLPAVSSPIVWRNIYYDPIRSATLLFMAEFLNKLLRTTSPDPLVWDFIFRSLKLLDEAEAPMPNFHLAFLINLSSFAGIRPDAESYHPGRWFDMQEGIFTDDRPAHHDYLIPVEAAALIQWMRITYANMHCFKVTGEVRAHLLQRILHYYSLHLPGTSNLKSPEILSELFH